MKYCLAHELPILKSEGLITARRHAVHPITIFNYSAKAQFLPIAEWSEALKDCRGLILDNSGEIVGRPFRKFWNLEQVADKVPVGEDFKVWEKLDCSLGIVCSYAGERIVATRGSFESDQAVWFGRWLDAKHSTFNPSGETWLFEILYPENRIVVDYGDRKEAVLLAVMSPDGVDIPILFDACERFRKAQRFDGMKDFDAINSDPQFAGQEGFVVQWSGGFRAKVKLEEYKRLHRLITQCSTRTIWELLRSGYGTKELLDRVPPEFAEWVTGTTAALNGAFESVSMAAVNAFNAVHIEGFPTRKDFAMWATKQPNHSLLFSLLDGKDITDACWKLAEPKWATPFRKEVDA